jgi:hypothetical protein
VPGAASLPRIVALRVGAGLALAVGCAQVFGIDEACQIGEPGCAAQEPCAEYCERVTAKCSADWPQYDDARGECESVCFYFERSSPGGPAAGNTLDCRLERARSSGGEEQSDCNAAGRGSNGACGSNCDAYCSLMRGVCPARYADFDTSDADDDEGMCHRVCEAMADAEVDYTPLPFEVNPRLDAEGQPTLYCRFWHLGTAAIELQQDGITNTFHCDHAFGDSECEPVTELAP